MILNARKRVVLALMLVLTWTSPTAASPEPLSLKYLATWGGSPAAEIRLHLEEENGAFRSRLDIETIGLARVLSGFRARVASEGLAGDAITPTEFDAIYDSRKKRDKRLNVLFLTTAGVTLAQDGPFDTNDDPPLSPELRRDVIDPLSILTVIRRLIRQRELGSDIFRLAIYDGKRRFDVEGGLASTGSMHWGKSTIGTIVVRLLLYPVAGFERESDDEHKPDAPAREVLVTFSNDDRAIPLTMTTAIAYVPAVISLDSKTKF